MNKVILVTGASSGIGFEIATYLSKNNYIVYGGSRSLAITEDFKPIKLDVTDDESVKEVVAEVFAREGRIDVLINNAGVGSAGAIEKTPIEDIRKSFEVNLFGVVRMCQAVLPLMRQNKFGKIINISTLGSMLGLPFRGFYSSSKGAMDLMTESMRLEVERFGIQACTIHPGEVKTNIGAHRIVSMPTENDVYAKTLQKAFAELDSSVYHGKDPKFFGPYIDKIIHSKRVKRNYYIGSFNELLGVKLKNILPYYLYEKILRSYFKAEG